MIYTSYYYQLQGDRVKQFPEELQLVVASNNISRFISKEARERLITTYQGITKPGLTIVQELKNGTIDEIGYTEAYIGILQWNLVSHGKLLYNLVKLAHDPGIVLFCYEGPTKFCHRHILARWLVNHASKVYGITLGRKEWDKLTQTYEKRKKEWTSR